MVKSIRRAPLLLSLCLVLPSCRSLTSLIQLTGREEKTFELIRKKNYCDKTSHQRVIESPLLSKKFEGLIKKSPPLGPFEQFALLAMLHLYYSPEVASPSADFIFLSFNSKNWQYFSFDPQSVKTSYPFLLGLNFLLKKHHSRYDLAKLAALMVRHLDPPPGLSAASAQFIQLKQGQLQNDENFQSFYRRSGDLLRAQESFRFKGFIPWIKKQLPSLKNSSLKLTQAQRLHPYQPGVQKDISVQCNLDINAYRDELLPVAERALPSMQFMLKDKEQIFVGLLSQLPNPERMIPQTPFFNRIQEVKTSSVLCISYRPPHPPIFLTSGDDRDPAQHLYHLLENGPHKKRDPSSFDQLLSNARHLFLSNPHRLLYESERGSKERLEKLLALNFPIYHSLRLGKVLAINHFAGKTYLFADDRHPMDITCR